MTAQLFYLPFPVAFSSNGFPVAGALANFYLTGTSTRTPVYSDSGLTTRLANPVPADGAGRFPQIYLNDTVTYRVVVTDPLGATLGNPVDPYIPGTIIGGNVGPSGTMLLSGIAFTTPQQFMNLATRVAGTTDDGPAFQAALDYLEALRGTGGSPMLYVPSGLYKIATTVNIKHRVRILGEGGGQAGATSSQISVPAGGYGFIVNRYNTLDETTVTARAYGADGTIIEGLDFVGPGSGTADETKAAVWFRARAVIRDCTINGIAGCGLKIKAQQGAGGALEGNANGWIAINVRIQNCAFDNLFINGADANAYVAISVDTANSGRWNVRESSFLGGKFVGCQSEAGGTVNNSFNGATKSSICIHVGRTWVIVPGQAANGLATTPGTNAAVWADNGTATSQPTWASLTAVTEGGAFYSSDSNAIIQWDAYTEPGQGPSWLSAQTIASGPQFANCAGLGTQFNSGGLDGGGFSSSKGFYAKRVKADGTTFLKHIMGCDPANNQWDLFVTPSGLEFGFATSGDDWYFQTSSLFEGFRVKHGFTPETFGRAANTGVRGAVQFQTGFWLGAGSGARQITQASGTPGAGDNAEGEVSFAANPSTVKALASVCYTGSATAPTWYKAGAIFIDASATYDPPSIAASGTTTTTVTATGAALGDIAQASFSLALGGLMMSAEVTSANTVTVRLFNPTGGAVDLGSGTLRVRVSKA